MLQRQSITLVKLLHYVLYSNQVAVIVASRSGS